MNARRKIPVVGSYAVIKSIAQTPRAQPAGAPKPKKKPRKKDPQREHAAPQQLTHTVRPTRHALLCYHCDEEFHVLGHHRVTVCPKCHDRVDVVDYTLEGEFDHTIRTAGHVHVTSSGVVRGGTIHASSLRLEGTAESGSIATIRLDLVEQGRIGPAMAARFRDLCIGADVDACFDAPLQCRNLTITGRIKARATVDELTVVKSGGAFEGELTARRLRVNEGGGLRAVLSVRNPSDPTSP